MEYMTTVQASTYLGISPTRIAKLIRDGRLKAEKAGNTWLILKTDVEEFSRVPRPEGWKKGKPRKGE